MLLNELMRTDCAPKILTSQIEFVADGNETNVISKRLEPTVDNIKRYLMQYLLTPLNEQPTAA